MKKYNYFVNNLQVTKKSFFATLKSCCRKVTHTEVIAGWCGVDFVEFDEKKYKKCVRDLNDGSEIFFIDAGKSFRRKEA